MPSGLIALARLRRLRVAAIRTGDAAAALDVSMAAANKLLWRLASAGHAHRLTHGLFWIGGEPPDHHCLPEIVTAPQPSYVSLHSALHIHGWIERIPSVVYAVSLARAHEIATPFGVLSIHTIAPLLFGGFEETARGVKLASPEKALFDLAYLSGTRDRRFARLPEIDSDVRIRRSELQRWTSRIESPRRRSMVEARLLRLLAR